MVGPPGLTHRARVGQEERCPRWKISCRALPRVEVLRMRTILTGRSIETPCAKEITPPLRGVVSLLRGAPPVFLPLFVGHSRTREMVALLRSPNLPREVAVLRSERLCYLPCRGFHLSRSRGSHRVVAPRNQIARFTGPSCVTASRCFPRCLPKNFQKRRLSLFMPGVGTAHYAAL